MGDEIHDSPDAWVAEHIRRYVATGGNARPGMDDLLLTTRGRRSGLLRRTALVFVRDGDRYVVTGSNAGRDRNPAWYLNLVADPRVTVQVGTDTFAGIARTVAGPEKHRLWRRFVAAVPAYERYRESTDRDIPVVVIEPTC
ncbi:nitroreductase family deazaflavin-dependent oxidoreductase [Micromonospora echinaurantiaca]|uniref:nitroreductase family deazaflavin-dependent oxidoreductase n=1 Tax=Micromonospora echinaurantiaca TaxID=47857 RepID=UPI003415DBA2